MLEYWNTRLFFLSQEIKFQARNISEVPVGEKKTDTQTSASLSYFF